MATPHAEFPFTIPADVKWVAQDSNGKWWGYTVEPHRNDSGWYENEVGDCVFLANADPVDWQHSLKVVNQT